MTKTHDPLEQAKLTVSGERSTKATAEDEAEAERRRLFADMAELGTLPEDSPFAGMARQELYALAERADIVGRNKMKSTDLALALEVVRRRRQPKTMQVVDDARAAAAAEEIATQQRKQLAEIPATVITVPNLAPSADNRYRAINSKSVSIRGQLTQINKGKIIDARSYGPDLIRTLLEFGVQLEPVTPVTETES